MESNVNAINLPLQQTGMVFIKWIDFVDATILPKKDDGGVTPVGVVIRTTSCSCRAYTFEGHKEEKEVDPDLANL